MLVDALPDRHRTQYALRLDNSCNQLISSENVDEHRIKQSSQEVVSRLALARHISFLYISVMHDARLIANRFIEAARAQGRALTPMQLLKLVYIAHGWMLALYGVPLVRDRVEAWKFGPVIPNLYRAMKSYGDAAVVNDLPNVEFDPLVPVEEDMIRQVFQIYGHQSGIALSDITHRPNTPWARVYQPYISHIPIPNDIIREHYQQLAQERGASGG